MSADTDKLGRQAATNGAANATRHFMVEMPSEAPGDHYGTVTIEYDPREYVLDRSGRRLTAFLADAKADAGPPDEFITAVYRGLVDVLFPGYDTRDAPWEYVPMIVEYEYTYNGRYSERIESRVALGSFG